MFLFLLVSATEQSNFSVISIILRNNFFLHRFCNVFNIFLKTILFTGAHWLLVILWFCLLLHEFLLLSNWFVCLITSSLSFLLFIIPAPFVWLSFSGTLIICYIVFCFLSFISFSSISPFSASYGRALQAFPCKFSILGRVRVKSKLYCSQ